MSDEVAHRTRSVMIARVPRAKSKLYDEDVGRRAIASTPPRIESDTELSAEARSTLDGHTEVRGEIVTELTRQSRYKVYDVRMFFGHITQMYRMS